MRFAPTDSQTAFAEATRALLRRSAPPEVVREAWADGRTPPRYWNSLADLGLLGVLAPEELGGGGSELDLLAALIEVGEAAAPGPVVETAAVGVPLLARFAPELLKNDELLRGGLTATMGDTVPYATAGACVVLGEHTIDLRRLVEFDALDALDRSRGVARLDVYDTASARVIAEGPDAREAYDAACDRAAAATAAVLVGLSRRALQMTVEYVGVRRQFGVPIGSFQAVKHHLANAHTAVEMAVPLVHAAAWAHAEDPSQARQLSSMAKVMANKAGRVTAKAALQCHGAIGYTTESDLHLYLMRIWSLLNAWGGTGDHVDRVAVEAGF